MNYHGKISNKDITFEIISSKNATKDKPIIFSHGFRAEPKVYRPFLKKLAKHGYESFALNRFRMKNRPVCLEEHLDLTYDFINLLGICAYHKIGHSLGGYITMKIEEKVSGADKLIAINPAIEVDYGILGFLKASAKIGYNDLSAFVEDKLDYNSTKIPAYGTCLDFINTASGFFNKILTTPTTALKVMNEMTDPTKFVYPDNKNKNLVILQSMNDEFFNINLEQMQKWANSYNNVVVKYISKQTHNFPVTRPEYCADLVIKILDTK